MFGAGIGARINEQLLQQGSHFGVSMSQPFPFQDGTAGPRNNPLLH